MEFRSAYLTFILIFLLLHHICISTQAAIVEVRDSSGTVVQTGSSSRSVQVASSHGQQVVQTRTSVVSSGTGGNEPVGGHSHRVVSGTSVHTHSRVVISTGQVTYSAGQGGFQMQVIDLSTVFQGIVAHGRKFHRMVGKTVSQRGFLEKFGYLSTEIQHTRRRERKALRAFQRFAGIKTTGLMDNTTQMLMESSRCGVEDMLGSSRMGRRNRYLQNNRTSKFDFGWDAADENPGEGVNGSGLAQGRRRAVSLRRAKRYSVKGSKWNKNHLTYYFENYSPDLSEDQIRDAIARAFQLWADVTPLNFTETANPQNADIVIKFASGVHGDGDISAFDGPGGTLAHAYFPENGDLHFDEDETFTVRSNEGTNIFMIAAHEVGHCLGLEHSSDTEALMYPWYLGYQNDFALSQDDIDGIQQIYGKPSLDRSEMSMDLAPTKSPNQRLPNTCNTTWDAATYYGPDDVVYAFRGRYMWAIGDNGVLQGYPKKTKHVFEGAPSLVYAVLNIGNKLYMFGANLMWLYVDKELESGFPRPIPEGLPSGPNAALRWGGNGKSYFFKGYRFYEFVESELRVEPAQKLLSQWPGVPIRMDTAFQWKNGRTYFFKGDDYWRYNDAKLAVPRRYPLSRSEIWLGCDTN